MTHPYLLVLAVFIAFSYSQVCFDNSGSGFSTATETFLPQLLIPSDRQVSERFGKAVDINGNRSVVCAYLADSSLADAGKCYVFVKNSTGIWHQVQSFFGPIPGASDWFGFSVDMDADYLIIGAPQAKVGAVTFAGTATIYHWNGTAYTNNVTISKPTPVTVDMCGTAVGIQGGTYALLGCPGDDTIATDGGAVYLWRILGPGSVVFNGSLAIPASNNDNSGSALAIQNNLVVIGASGYDGVGTSSGRGYLFDLSNGVHTLKYPFISNPYASGDLFGSSVAVYNPYILVGAPSAATTGEAYLFFNNNDTNAVELAMISSANPVGGANFAGSVALYQVSLSRINIVVGEYNGNAIVGGTGVGAAYVYVYDMAQGVIRELTQLLANGGQTGDHFGGAVAADGRNLLIGAEADHLSSCTTSLGCGTGTAYIYAPANCTNTTGTCYNLNFQVDDFGVPIAPGTTITNQYALFNLTISSFAPLSHPIKIFNSSSPTCANGSQIGTRNVAFGGPGVGSGGTITNSVNLNSVLIIQDTCPNATNLGATTHGAGFDVSDSDNLSGNKFSTGASHGITSTMSVFVGPIDSNPANQLFRMGIYSDSGGLPNSLLAVTAVGNLVANSWNTIDLPPITLAASTTYWLIYNTNGLSSGVNNYAKAATSGGGNVFSTFFAFGSGFPSTFPLSGHGTDVLILSMYVTYCNTTGCSPQVYSDIGSMIFNFTSPANLNSIVIVDGRKASSPPSNISLYSDYARTNLESIQGITFIGTDSVQTFSLSTANLIRTMVITLGGPSAISTLSYCLASSPICIPLGNASNFTILADDSITNTGNSIINGNLGIDDTTSLGSVTGFPPGIVTGSKQIGTTSAINAMNDAVTVINTLIGLNCGTDLTGTNLGGLTLTQGVYCWTTAATLTGTLKLDAQGDQNAVFVFQMLAGTNSLTTTNNNAIVTLINGGSICNIYWYLAHGSTFGTHTTIIGNIFNDHTPTVGSGTVITGRLISQLSITMTNTTITPCSVCVAAPSPAPAPAPAPSPKPAPKPAPLPAPSPFAPSPKPAPLPSPIPAPLPAPNPAPLPAPFPAPLPAPIPSPVPAPLPAPLPAPSPAPAPLPLPSPNPAPLPSPNPPPLPSPNPAPLLTPAPFPAPLPSPNPAPLPAPLPAPIPAPFPPPLPAPIPAPIPAPFPAPAPCTQACLYQAQAFSSHACPATSGTQSICCGTCVPWTNFAGATRYLIANCFTSYDVYQTGDSTCSLGIVASFGWGVCGPQQNFTVGFCGGAPSPIPLPNPAPLPLPLPSPNPLPLPAPAPLPAPFPAPAPAPAPLPAPSPDPAPSPLPSPLPAPSPDPAPSPLPSPVPAPFPAPFPSPNPAPNPAPAPLPAPIPAPFPAPSPDPAPSPLPAPLPSPDPAPAPIPAPFPAPSPCANACIYHSPFGFCPGTITSTESICCGVCEEWTNFAGFTRYVIANCYVNYTVYAVGDSTCSTIMATFPWGSCGPGANFSVGFCGGSPVPAPFPAPFPAPIPSPLPLPAPFPAPSPDPAPSPLPAPSPDPAPSPLPSPNPAPFPAPDPAPAPSPDPSPAPAPDPAPAPFPSPIPAPLPAPSPPPVPSPAPAPINTPSPAPAPIPAPFPSPNPAPFPAPIPAPLPSPNPAPFPAPAPSPAFNESCVSLGNAAPYGVLAATTITNTGISLINGSLGLYPGTSVTDSGTLTVTGSTDVNNAAAQNAQTSLTTAVSALSSLPCDVVLTGIDLGTLTLLPGVYCYATSAGLTGTLTLNAQGNPNAVFVFQIGSTLTTASSAMVSLINGGSICNIYWVVGSSATLGTGTSFIGNILAAVTITVTTGSTLTGRALAQTGAVTLDTNSIAVCPTCVSPAPAPFPSPIPSPKPAPFPLPLPSPNPAPFPSPNPLPSPNPAPFPSPRPAPLPQPNPAPLPQPSPSPSPIPDTCATICGNFSGDALQCDSQICSCEAGTTTCDVASNGSSWICVEPVECCVNPANCTIAADCCGGYSCVNHHCGIPPPPSPSKYLSSKHTLTSKHSQPIQPIEGKILN
jgi:hypothetical protein